jgi:hypothetical protein
MSSSHPCLRLAVSSSRPFQMHVQSCFASTILFPLCSFHPAKSRIVHITSLIYHEAMLIIFLVELECSHVSPPPHNAYVLCSFSCTTGLSCCRKPLKSGIICRNPDMICLSVSRLQKFSSPRFYLPLRSCPAHRHTPVQTCPFVGT